MCICMKICLWFNKFTTSTEPVKNPCHRMQPRNQLHKIMRPRSLDDSLQPYVLLLHSLSHMLAFLCCGSSRNWWTYISKCLFTKMVGSGVDLWGCEISVWWQPKRWVVFLHWLKFPSLFMVWKSPIGTCSRAQRDLTILETLTVGMFMVWKSPIGSCSRAQRDLPYWKHSLLVCSEARKQGSSFSASCSAPWRS